ncbi:hypothetical protein MNBD_GAMMA25-1606 [hydrothermal vent metagenome]|uniref:Organiser of macrodomain of Terminus of chromosome n=1 Tax=hydrothermal vent metagenome TaxID=652676 RepID=A0A3B1AZ84_9ZZZZ
MTIEKITMADQFYATQWLHVMLNKDDWLSSQIDQVVKARDEFKKICLANTPDRLNDFCKTWLSPTQWAELDKTITAARERRKSTAEQDEHHAGVNLTHRAKFILERLSKQYDCSISDVIEQHLVDRVNCDLPSN